MGVGVSVGIAEAVGVAVSVALGVAVDVGSAVGVKVGLWAGTWATAVGVGSGAPQASTIKANNSKGIKKQTVQARPGIQSPHRQSGPILPESRNLSIQWGAR